MHTLKEIIENQKTFKQDIIDYLISDFKKINKIVNSIETSDAYIKTEKIKIKNRLKKIQNPQKHIDSFFVSSKNKSEEMYVWWDKEENEAKILPYAKK